MNRIAPPLRGTASSGSHAFAPADTLEARFALRLTARLTERSRDLGPDITERLRFARETALTAARTAPAADATAVVGSTQRAGAAILGRLGSGWWIKLGSIAPVFVLIAGLVLIERWQANSQISVAAEVDAALLSDALPPTAYGDAGFAEFLKTPSE